MSKKRTAITPTRQEDYPEWYQQVVKASDLAENSPVRGCMVIKPWGYALWENIQRVLDGMFKATGHKNAYFPLFIPKSFLEKEAQHVEGFAKECAVVTHHRLEAGAEGKLVPAGELEEPLIVRPTSETIIGAMFSKWVQSYRDLPLLINQWANVVRWEMRTRMFLRTAEFLWQEGHTVHATAQEAQQETMKMLRVYADFAENYMAMPVIQGEKTESERFPGADTTYCIEAMMQDRKALQAGTSHFLGQNFSKASEIKFQNDAGVEEFAWTTSWGVSTRLVGGLIMTHGDDDGLMIPPKLAPSHIVIIPVIHGDDTASEVMEYCQSLASQLRDKQYDKRAVEVEVDTRDMRGGDKVWSWIKKGAPVYLEIGPRDIASDSVFVGRRDKSRKERYSQPRAEFVAKVAELLDDIQNSMFEKAKKFRDSNIVTIDTKDDFYNFFTPKNKNKPEIHGGFAMAHWNGSKEVEEKIKNDLNVTIRCIPLDANEEQGKCIITGELSKRRVVFGKSY
ncbi:proline--tRNA ligase [Chitinispirillales bacterium ANBcel5]|uniref:proline--tRNA ligase n=1 Tax=Cellulosispirillum alkaliphilum TaxID=3039283 RepID=UPI002A55400F|nr:proline--tRNA ligase [Chitinispirillales bacterium ANBcel5]